MPVPKGVRIGGKPKGYKFPKTVEKEAALEALRALVLEQLRPMVEAQMEHAKGVRYMMLRRKDGTYARATDQKQVDAAVAAGAQAFDLFTQAPNTQAFMTLMDRTFGRPVEHTELNVSGSLDIVGLLAKRHRKKD